MPEFDIIVFLYQLYVITAAPLVSVGWRPWFGIIR